jgi:hypothetical protein
MSNGLRGISLQPLKVRALKVTSMLNVRSASVCHMVLLELIIVQSDRLMYTIREHQERQDRQCTYNETLKRVHETIIAVEKQ